MKILYIYIFISSVLNLFFQNVKVFTFVGNNKIDVPANGQRDYRAEFYSYKESKYNFKVSKSEKKRK